MRRKVCAFQACIKLTAPIELALIDRPDIPSAGAGETPIVGIAPAVANAIFHAREARVRTLPLLRDGRLAGPLDV